MRMINFIHSRKRKTSVAILIMVSTVTMTATNASVKGSSESPNITEVKTIAKRYASSLKTILKKKLVDGGPVVAIDACSNEAARISGEISRATGWSVRRVTNQTRNPLAIPDVYEAKILDAFSKEIKKQPAAAKLVKYEVVNENGINYARFMKGIRVQPVCLGCHGTLEKMSMVDKKLTQSYPHDKARGYKVGDLRGALSIKIKLD